MNRKIEVYLAGDKRPDGKRKLTFVMAIPEPKDYPLTTIYNKFKQIYRIKKIYLARMINAYKAAYIETK